MDAGPPRSNAVRERPQRPFQWPRMRPRFILELDCSADTVMEALRSEELPDEHGIAVRYSERHGILTVCEEEQQFWSTELGLTIEDAGPAPDGTPRATRVLGVFSPHPEIWTGYVFTVGVLGVIGAFSSMWAIVQWSLGRTPWAALIPPAAVLLAVLVYLSTLVGQGLALNEMYRLRSYLDERLKAAGARETMISSTRSR